MAFRPFVIVVAVSLLAGCGVSPTQQLAQVRAAATARAKAVDATSKASFVAAAKAKGISLTEDQLAELQAERAVKPNNTWAPRPAANLTADQNLQTHFLKHGHEFNPKITSAAAYMAQGNAAGNGDRGPVRFFFDTTSFDKGYQTHVVRWVQKTHDFTAFKPDGSETTYYQNDPQPSRFIEVPAW